MCSPSAPALDRIVRERTFWNQAYSPSMYDGWTEKSYAAWRRNRPAWWGATEFLGTIQQKRVLMCGVGKEAILFARAGARVSGFDVSEHQVAAVDALARRVGVTVDLDVMPFEQLAYADHSFDLAYGSAILHHIDLGLGSRELARVLKPGGRAAFVEPLGENPLLGFARRHLPYPNKSRTVDESPLTFRDIETFGQAFAAVQHTEVSLLAMLRPRIVRHVRAGKALAQIDDVLLDWFPSLGRLCSETWIGVEAKP